MATIELVAETDSEITGELGWLPVNSDTNLYQPTTDATGLAHDMLEHFATRNVADEIEAAGSIYHIRYETGYSPPVRFARNVTMDDLGSDMLSMFEALAYKDDEIPFIVPQKPLSDEIEEDIRSIIQYGRKLIQNENPDGMDSVELDMLCERYPDYFRKGYRRSRMRFLRCPCRATMFQTVRETIERTRPEYEGQRVIVHLNYLRGSVQVEEKYPEEY